MIDYVIRNARLAGATDALTDIGFENGRIAALEPVSPATRRPMTREGACAAAA